MRCPLELGATGSTPPGVYGLGHSEEVVGRLAARTVGEAAAALSTKCGFDWNAADPIVRPHRVFKPETILHEYEASLQLLSVERSEMY
jgi:aryl-alcohol dehydrogenase-like predicted oxidoreductase